MRRAVAGPPKLIAPSIGKGLSPFFPSKAEGEHLVKLLRDDLAEFASADRETRVTLRRQLETRRRETWPLVRCAGESLRSQAHTTRLLDELTLSLERLGAMAWNPCRDWVSPYELKVFREFVQILVKREKEDGAKALIWNDGRRVVIGIFDRGMFDFLSAQFQQFK